MDRRRPRKPEASLKNQAILAASYDKTLRYGAQTPFSDQLAFQWVGSLWEYDVQHNSRGVRACDAFGVSSYHDDCTIYGTLKCW